MNVLLLTSVALILMTTFLVTTTMEMLVVAVEAVDICQAVEKGPHGIIESCGTDEL